jgi:hypothetical protein
MNHAITVGDLLLIGGALLGFALMLIGGFPWIISGLQDCPDPETVSNGKRGGVVALAGITILVLCMWCLL